MAGHTKKHHNHSMADVFHDDVNNLKNTVYSIADKIKVESRERGNEVLDQTRAHPVKTMAIAMGVGLILGMLLKK